MDRSPALAGLRHFSGTARPDDPAAAIQTQPRTTTIKHEPVKDPHHSCPIPDAWRQTIRDVVRALVAGDYQLERGVPTVAPPSRRTASHAKAYVEDYGETLVELPDRTWTTSLAQWMDGHWDVLVDLWTHESGSCDMVLFLRVYEDGSGFRFEIDALHVDLGRRQGARRPGVVAASCETGLRDFDVGFPCAAAELRRRDPAANRERDLAMTIPAPELAYLHDALLTTVVYQTDPAGCREITLGLICDPDAGHPTWNGKAIRVRLHDLVVSNHFLFGAVTASEQFDSWGSRLSPSLAAEIERLRSTGISVTGHSFHLTFHSGSVLEGVCREIFVEMHDDAKA